MLEIWCEQLSGDWIWDYDKYIGGTNEFVVKTAENAPFKNVIVYYDGKEGEQNGVIYKNRREYIGKDIVMCCNHYPNNLGRYNIMWSNWFHAKETDYLRFDERIVQSKYHQSIFGNNSRLIPLSCDNVFDGNNKDNKLCLYSSSPDRGLDFLLSIWNNIEKETGARLVHTYKKDISEAEMIELYNKSKFWLHPCNGVELFCVSALKAQCAKCIPVVVPNMALEETVRYGIKTNLDNYEKDLINAIKNPPNPEEIEFPSWKEVTLELFKNCYE